MVYLGPGKPTIASIRQSYLHPSSSRTFAPYGKFPRIRYGRTTENVVQLDLIHWAARRSASLRFPWMSVGLLVGRCRCPKHAKSHPRVELHAPRYIEVRAGDPTPAPRRGRRPGSGRSRVRRPAARPGALGRVAPRAGLAVRGASKARTVVGRSTRLLPPGSAFR
jgi:hypothetical protein